jgi:gluconate 2-dehydrogenase gamma chain
MPDHDPTTETPTPVRKPVIPPRPLHLTRRGLLAGTAVIALTPIPTDAQSTADATPTAAPPPVVPHAPDAPPEGLAFFDEPQAAALEALVARIFPGTPEDPGARELGVLQYIDHLLATSDDGHHEPIYSEGPFPEEYEGDEPPEEDPGENAVWVPADDLDRYGWQSELTPREIYTRGLESLDAFAREEAGSDFASLSEDDQDEIVGALADDEADIFEDPSAGDFFTLVHRHTLEGLFSDPLYGGNRDAGGWRLIGYPGAQRAYTPTDMRTEGSDRDPISLADLPVFHAGRPDEHPQVVQPVRGGEEDSASDE